jgi:hypothetical protein
VNDPTDPYDYPILLPANGSVLIDNVLPGDTWLSLGDVASNCAIVGPNDQAVPVNAGATSEVTLAVTCVGNLPSIRVTIATTGTDVDPDGYQLLLSGLRTWCAQPSWNCGQVPVNGVFTVSGAAAFDQYEVGLWGVAPNCAVSGENERYVTVTGGATIDVMFAITCSSNAVTGSIRVTTETTGAYIPNWDFLQVVFQGIHHQLPANGVYLFTAVPTGDYPIKVNVLVAANCAVSPPNPRTVTVAADTTVDVVFPVTCRS